MARLSFSSPFLYAKDLSYCKRVLRRRNDVRRIQILFTLFCFSVSLFASPEWMERQISEDLSPFMQDGYCSECMLRFFKANKERDLLCLITIQSNQIDCKTGHDANKTRVNAIHRALRKLSKKHSLPDVRFVVSVHDALHRSCSFPVFVMSKTIQEPKILFPDFSALSGKYQVINGINLETTNFPIPWRNRKDLLIWRGSGAQEKITCENMNRKNRVILCRLGQEHPDMIDAGFTFCISSCIEEYGKEFVSFEEIFSHRYQIWLDGNAASYSNSGWRLYTGSTVLKPDSPYTQWYYGDLQPWVHYVPVKEDLSDLIDTIRFLRENEKLAAQIAENGLQFAREHITNERNLLYLHDLLWAYASLPVTKECSCCH